MQIQENVLDFIEIAIYSIRQLWYYKSRISHSIENSIEQKQQTVQLTEQGIKKKFKKNLHLLKIKNHATRVSIQDRSNQHQLAVIQRLTKQIMNLLLYIFPINTNLERSLQNYSQIMEKLIIEGHGKEDGDQFFLIDDYTIEMAPDLIESMIQKSCMKISQPVYENSQSEIEKFVRYPLIIRFLFGMALVCIQQFIRLDNLNSQEASNKMDTKQILKNEKLPPLKLKQPSQKKRSSLQALNRKHFSEQSIQKKFSRKNYSIRKVQNPIH